jgi:hypothetical protein
VVTTAAAAERGSPVCLDCGCHPSSYRSPDGPLSCGVRSHSPLSWRGAVCEEGLSEAYCIHLLEVGEHGCYREGHFLALLPELVGGELQGHCASEVIRSDSWMSR